MSDALRYENFIRFAFGIHQGTNDVERGEDPARLAEAGIFNSPSDLTRVKVGVSYAMEVLSSHIKNGDFNLTDDEYNRMSTILDEVLNASNHTEVSQLIEEYKDRFFNRYLGTNI
ncbi:MAG TPA: hypothetical protein VNM69_06610 [Bacillus sp. (in: firmicutes)]|nr:hypothetical protein [Bacillus sp. (in: firmicutes)]